MKNVYISLFVLIGFIGIISINGAEAAVEEKPSFHVKFDATKNFLIVKLKHSETKTAAQAQKLYENTNYFRDIHQFFPCGENNRLLKIENLPSSVEYQFKYIISCESSSRAISP